MVKILIGIGAVTVFLCGCDSRQTMDDKYQEAKDYFTGTDKNGNGKIDFEEFSHNGYTPKGVPAEVERKTAQEAFKIYDKNRDGYIDKDEAKSAGLIR